MPRDLASLTGAFAHHATRQRRIGRSAVLSLAALALMSLAGGGSARIQGATMAGAAPCPTNALNLVVPGTAERLVACNVSMSTGEPAAQLYSVTTGLMIRELPRVRLVGAADTNEDGVAELILERAEPPPCPCAKPGADLVAHLAVGGLWQPTPVLTALNLVTGSETLFEDDAWRLHALPATVAAEEARKGGGY